MNRTTVARCAIALSLTLGLGGVPRARAEGPIKNGLSSQALRRNALTTNAQALTYLRGHALDQSLVSPDFHEGYIARQLVDPRAQAVLAEVMKCALGPSAQIALGAHVWTGELGLCPGGVDATGAPQPSWGASGPDLACQQVVTGCVLSRINGMHRAIPLALRAPADSLLPARDPVSATQQFREPAQISALTEGAPIESFRQIPCTSGRDCGWRAAYVGTCTAGTVRLAISEADHCDTAHVRVCAGIHGCDGVGSTNAVPAGFPTDPPYTALLADQHGACAGHEVQFACSTAVSTGGYFSVMIDPPGRPLASQAPTLRTKGTGSYPASTREVFTFREGAFYGNLFDVDALRYDCQITGTMRECTPRVAGLAVERCPAVSLVGDGAAGTVGCAEARTLGNAHLFACFSLAQQQDTDGVGTDDEGVAYLNARICDEPDASCFPTRPTRCHYVDPAVNAARGAHCTYVDGRYQTCAGPDGTRYPAITSFLNDPCDLLGAKRVCTRLRVLLRSASGGVTHAPGVVERRRGCGCTLGARN